VANLDSTAAGQYDFGLTPAEEARAMRPHRESIVVDLRAQQVGATSLCAHYPPELPADFNQRMVGQSDWERLTEPRNIQATAERAQSGPGWGHIGAPDERTCGIPSPFRKTVLIVRYRKVTLESV
jgi:hypothetical protein